MRTKAAVPISFTPLTRRGRWPYHATVPEYRPGPVATDATVVEIDGRVALFIPATQELAFLNTTASDVLRLCDSHRTLDDIVSRIASDSGIPPKAVSDSVTQAIESFVAKSLFGIHP
jgi:Coenzyme PQQ synthesis protein D (PqqD)